MKKRLLPLLLALILALSLLVPAAATDLSDYADKDEIIYKEAVDVLSREGIITGFEENGVWTFRPTETLTRAQASTILTRILGGVPEGAPDFTDVKANAWYAGYVAYCAYNGLVAGYGNGTFNPTGELTGSAWSKMLLTGLGYDAEASGMLGSGWQTGVATLASEESLYAGIPNFDPTRPVTRDEACQIAYNAMYDGEVPEPANDILSQLSYSFPNTRSAFSYPSPYRIPMDIFRLVYGDEISAEVMYEKFGEWGGNCYGMVSTAALLYQHGNGISPSDFNSRVSVPGGLSVTERSKAISLTLTQFIEALHVTQLSEELNEVKANNWDDLNGLCAAVKEARQSGKAPVLVCVWGAEGGHAIMGYDVVEVSSTESRVLVYDPNYPMDYCYITLTKSGGSYTGWSYPISYDLIWGSEKGGAMSFIPYSDYYQGWQNRKGAVVTADMLFMTVSDDAMVYDDYGSLVAEIRDGDVTVYQQDAYPMRNTGILLDGSGFPSTETTIWLPGHGYSVRHTGYGEFTVELTEQEQTVSVTTDAGAVSLNVADADALRTVRIPGSEEDSAYTIRVRSSMEDGGPASVTLTGTVPGSGVKAGAEQGRLVTDGADPSRDTLTVDGKTIYENSGSGSGSGGSGSGGSSGEGGASEPFDTGKGYSAPADPQERSGRGEQPATPVKTGSSVQLSVAKTIYAPEEPINVGYFGVTQTMADHSAWICVSDVNTPANNYKAGWKEPEAGSGTVTLNAPYDEGTYELRFYAASAANDDNLDDSTVIRFTVERPELTKNVTLRAPKTVYAPEEPITVSYSGVTQWLKDHSAWICVSDRNSPSNNYKAGWKEPEAGSGAVTLNAPFDEGEYEIRFYDSSAANDLDLVSVLTIPFTVVHGELTKDVELKVAKTLYAPEEPITVSYSGVTQWLKDHSAWICVSDRNSPSNNYKAGWKEPDVGSGTVTLNAPFDEGEYELRFYDGSAANDLNQVARLIIPFTVKHRELTKNVSLSVSKTSFAPKEDIMVSYSGVTQWLKDHSAWICVSDANSPANNYKAGWKEPDVGSGTVTLTAPSEAGTYELRFYDGSAANDLNLAEWLTITFTVG